MPIGAILMVREHTLPNGRDKASLCNYSRLDLGLRNPGLGYLEFVIRMMAWCKTYICMHALLCKCASSHEGNERVSVSRGVLESASTG